MIVLGLGVGCGANGDEPASWHVVHQNLPGALLSVWGTSDADVWTVGADSGQGPTVLHYDGATWEPLTTGTTGDLWWVHGFAGGPVFLAGENGTIVRYDDTFTAMPTPGTGVVFGIWGASADDMWAVGGAAGGGSGAFVWRLEQGTWTERAEVTADIRDRSALWKVSGRDADDVWMVGTSGTAFHWDGTALTHRPIPTGESLFTVDASTDRFVAVGGFGTGLIFEHDGTDWRDVSLPGGEMLIGVDITEDDGYAVGQFGAVLRRTGDRWQPQLTGLSLVEGLHAVWLDPAGGVWAVGGQVSSLPLVRGILIHRGELIEGLL
jgi:hypothetical protein